MLLELFGQALFVHSSIYAFIHFSLLHQEAKYELCLRVWVDWGGGGERENEYVDTPTLLSV